MALSVDLIVGEHSALIVSEKTGVFYTDQCDGIGCSHPEYEGFLLAAGTIGQDFSLCKYGCCELSDPKNINGRAIAADAINRYFAGQKIGQDCKITFDMTRIDELQENWIPVLVSGVFDKFSYPSLTFESQKAILTGMGNCD